LSYLQWNVICLVEVRKMPKSRHIHCFVEDSYSNILLDKNV
jgi:hypothetical protein